MEKCFIGIDVGKQGGISIVDKDGSIIESMRMPLVGKEYDTDAIKKILRTYKTAVVGIEDVGVIFGIGKSSLGSMMRGKGLLEGMVIMSELPLSMIHAKTWQKLIFELGIKQYKFTVKEGKSRKSLDTKATALVVARRLWPTESFIATSRSTKPHDGIIDSLLIAEYLRRTNS